MTANKMPDWEIVLNVKNPNYHGKEGRPRRMSMYTLATCCGREDIQALIKEIRESGKVVGYKCPDVGGACIFYLTSLRTFPGMIDSADRNNPNRVWDQLNAFLKEKPYPKYKGFKRFARNGDYGMPDPFEPEDYAYARRIKSELEKAGYKSGLDNIPEFDPPRPVPNCNMGCSGGSSFY